MNQSRTIMHQWFRRLVTVLFGLALFGSLVSCGGSGSSGGDGDSVDGVTQGKGTVGILLTDMPADPALFDSINASIVKVELLGSEDNGRVTLYSGEERKFDLLRLRNESIPLTFKDGVPAGKYCKIRLTLSDLELVLADATPSPDDNETYHPKLPGNGKLDLVVRDCFYVAAGKVVTLQVDIDAGKSIHVVANKKGYKFRPVIFVDVIDEAFDSKLLRLTGTIDRVYPEERSLLLCDAFPGKDMDNHGCVKVYTDPHTSAFFDNQQHEGSPRSLDELLSDDKLGLEVTVVGWPRFWSGSDDDDYESRMYYPLLRVDALVVELGGLLQVEGTVDASPVIIDPNTGETGFDMSVSAGPIITNDALTVLIQDGDQNINGTRIVSKSGALLEPSGITANLPVKVDGVLDIARVPALLKAALVIVDKSALGAEQVTGLVISTGVDTLTLDPDAAVVCGQPFDDLDTLEVELTDNLEILTVTITDTLSVIKPGGTVDAGDTVGMSGYCQPDGSYQTDNIVVVEDLRNDP